MQHRGEDHHLETDALELGHCDAGVLPPMTMLASSGALISRATRRISSSVWGASTKIRSAPASRVEVAALDRVVERGDRAGVGAGDDDEVGIGPVLGGRADLVAELLGGDHLLARDVPALLGRHLVLDVEPGHARLLVFPHRAHDVEGVAVAGVGVRDDRQRDAGREMPPRGWPSR